MKKKHIIFFLFILAPFLCSVGISSWLISESVSFNPEYEILDVIKTYYDNQESTYKTDGQFTAIEQQPSSSNKNIITDEIVQNKCTIMYRKNGQSQWSNNMPTNAGKYEIQYTYKNRSIVVNYTINPAAIKPEEFGYTFVEAQLQTIIEGENTKIISGGTIINGGEDITSSGTISYDTSNLAYPADSTNESEIVSTTIKWLTSDGNYFINIPASVSMYAVAYNSSTGIYYGTVEKALSDAVSGNKVWVLGNIQPTTGFYPTIKEDCVVNSGVSLNLSYSSTDLSEGYLIDDKGVNSNATIPSYLYVEEGITISNYGSILVGASVYATGSDIYSPAVIMNSGSVVCYDGSKIEVYGYIKGNGSILVNSGATVQEEFYIFDWPGGKNGVGLNSEGLFPFNIYSFTGISCNLKVLKGGYLNGRFQIDAGTMLSGPITLVGPSGLFELTGLNSDYILISTSDTTSVTNINTDIKKPNRNITLRNNIDISGDFIDNSLSIKVQVIISTTISTSTDKAMPIGLMTVRILNGNGTLRSNSYKFLPGSRLEICEGSTVTIDSKAKVVFFDENFEEKFNYTQDGAITTATYKYQTKHKAWYDKYSGTEELGAIFTCNGEFICNGGFGGKCFTSSESAKVILSNSNAQIKMLSSLAYSSSSLSFSATASSTTNTYIPKMKMYTSSGIAKTYSPVSTGTYYSIKDSSGNFGWRTTSLKLSYDLNGGSGEKPNDSSNKTVGSSGYIILDSDIPKVDLTKQHYTFAGWALDIDGVELVEPGVTTVYASTTLYATWDPIVYTITYQNSYYDFDDNILGNELTTNPNVNTLNGTTTYTVADNPPMIFKAPTLLNNDGNALVFGGWYTNSLCTDEYKLTSTEQLSGNCIVYAYWYPYGTFSATIKFELDIHEDIKDDFPSGDVSLADEEAPFIGGITTWKPIDYSSYNNNSTLGYYFDGWYLDSNYENKFSSEILSSMVGDDTLSVVLYAKILPKIKVIYDEAPEDFTYSSNKPNDYFVMPNSVIYVEHCVPINNISYSDSFENKFLYIVEGFTINNESTIYTNQYNVLSYTNYKEIIIKPATKIVTYYKIVLQDKDGHLSSFSITSGVDDEGYCVSGGTVSFSFTITKGSNGLFGIGSWYRILTFTMGSSSIAYQSQPKTAYSGTHTISNVNAPIYVATSRT